MHAKNLVGVVVNSRGERTLEPSGIPLGPRDLEKVATPIDVWANCEVPSANEVLKSPIAAKSILYLPCDEAVEFSGLSEGGIRIFARENREIPFVYFNRSALAFALAKKLIEPSVRVDVMMSEGNRLLSPLLGLDKPEWNAPMRAFHVVGAVEAVEWFRSPKLTPPQAQYQAP